MSQEIAQSRISEETQQFVRRVRRATRRKFSPEEKVRIVLEEFRGETKICYPCRREGNRSPETATSLAHRQSWCLSAKSA